MKERTLRSKAWSITEDEKLCWILLLFFMFPLHPVVFMVKQTSGWNNTDLMPREHLSHQIRVNGPQKTERFSHHFISVKL